MAAFNDNNEGAGPSNRAEDASTSRPPQPRKDFVFVSGASSSRARPDGPSKDGSFNRVKRSRKETSSTTPALLDTSFFGNYVICDSEPEDEDDTEEGQDLPGETPELPGVSLPTHFNDFLRKSIQEYKKLFYAVEKSKQFLQKLCSHRDEGTLPSSIRMKPPKLVVPDDQADAMLQSKMRVMCDDYNKGILACYIQAQETILNNQEQKVKNYHSTFAANLTQLFEVIKDLDFFDAQQTLWKCTLDKWREKLTLDFKAAINNFRLTHFLDNQIKKNATSRRQQKQDQAMEDAEQLPKEESIATLIKKKVAEEINKVKAQLKGKNSHASKKTNTGKKVGHQPQRRQRENGRPQDNGQQQENGRHQENGRPKRNGQQPPGTGQQKTNGRQQGKGQQQQNRKQNQNQNQNQGNGQRHRWTSRMKQSTHTNASAISSNGKRSAPTSGLARQQRPQQRPQQSFTAPKPRR